MVWRECSFDELTVHELYEVLRLRSEVFVVEQDCAFQDMDDKDAHARHLMGTVDGFLVAYARLFAPGDYYRQASIGRVVTAPASRGIGVGKQLMRHAVDAVEQRWGCTPIRIGAQAYLKRFYEGFGFERDGDDYLEDGIVHLHMLRPASAASA